MPAIRFLAGDIGGEKRVEEERVVAAVCPYSQKKKGGREEKRTRRDR